MLTQSTLINPKEEISNQQVIMHILSKMKKEVPVHTDQADDYGPHRFCNECGIELIDVYDSMDNEAIWMHPESDCTITEVVDVDDMNAGSFNHDNMDMDDLREVFKIGKGKKAYHHNHKLIEENWLKKNAKVLKRIYNYVDVNGEDPESGSKVYTKARFNEEVNDDEGNTVINETSASDVGISYEERTHESFARLRFWENMVWMIAHCPDRAYDKAISRMHDDPNEDIIHEEEAMWVDHVTGGVRNNGLMRFAQYNMMAAKKFAKVQADYDGFILELKEVNLHTFAHLTQQYNYSDIKERRINCITYGCANRIKPPKFDNVIMTVTDSPVYEKFVVLSFLFNGIKVKLMKGKTATNWINPMKLDHDTLNEAIDWARKELKPIVTPAVIEVKEESKPQPVKELPITERPEVKRSIANQTMSSKEVYRMVKQAFADDTYSDY